MDYFEIFSLPPHLTLDTAALEKSFYALSRRLHPDRFALPRSINSSKRRLYLRYHPVRVTLLAVTR
jgi:DnaJ-domain-containing protein 1